MKVENTIIRKNSSRKIQEYEFQEIILILPIMKEPNQIFLILEESNQNSIFIYLQQLMNVAEIISEKSNEINYPEVSRALRKGIISRLLKYEKFSVLKRFIIETILNPNFQLENVILEEFQDIAQEALEELKLLTEKDEFIVEEELKTH
jgi:hypothetical protein